MKKVNRYHVIFGLWAATLCVLCVISTNTLLNAVVLLFGLILAVMAAVAVSKKQNVKEAKFMSELLKIFD